MGIQPVLYPHHMEPQNKTTTELGSDASTLGFIDYKLTWTIIQHTNTTGGGKQPRALSVRGF